MAYKETREFREWLVETYNSAQPQKKVYLEEFDEYITVAEGGIYDSEYMCYVSGEHTSPRIKEILRLLEKDFGI